MRAGVGDYLRVCDVCGHDWPRSKLRPIGQKRLACPDDHPGYHDVQMQRLERSSRPFPPPIRPRRDAQQSNPTELYERAEASLFNMVMRAAPYESISIIDAKSEEISTTKTARVAGEACLYLWSVIEEGLRPKRWVGQANAKFRELTDWLLTRQSGPHLDTSITAYWGRATVYEDPDWGGVVETDIQTNFVSPYTQTTTRLITHTTCLAGLAFLRAYRLWGDDRYRQAYRAALTYLARLVSTDAYPANGLTGAETYLCYPTSPTPYNYRYWPANIAVVANNQGGSYARYYVGYQSSFSATLRTRDILGLAFLREAIELEGGETVYGDVSVVGGYKRATATSLTQMAEGVVSFWRDGILGYRSSPPLRPQTSAPSTGFSTVTPDAMGFDARAASPVGQISGWRLGNSLQPWTDIEMYEFAYAAYGWHAYHGTDARGAEIMQWIRAATVNREWTSDYALEGLAEEGYTKSWFSFEPYGDFDSRIPAEEYTLYGIDYDEDDPNAIPRLQNNTYYYSPSTLGLLAPIYSAVDAAGFAFAKRELSKMRPFIYVGPDTETHHGSPDNAAYVNAYEYVPMSLYSLPKYNGYVDVGKAALAGLMYRYNPKIGTVR